MRNIKTTACLLALMAAVTTATACGSKQSTDTSAENIEADKTGYTTLDLDKDGKDIKTTIKILTQRIDIVNDTDAENELPDYAKTFNELYPDIKVEYIGIDNYDEDVTKMLKAGDTWDVCSIPATMNLTELPEYFEPFGSTAKLGETYQFIEKRANDGIVYGIPSGGNAQGIIYNKKVWKNAGIDTNNLPKTPEEFIEDLQKIKDQTDAIPLYTNYAAGWPLITWDYHALATGYGDSNIRNTLFTTTSEPFGEDNAATYNVYKILYDAVSKGLTEDDPTTTDWDACKSMINRGEIGCMVLGNWAISQFQDAGDEGYNICYMPFPMQVNGKQYAITDSDYCYGVNKNADENNKKAAELYIKYITERSDYSYNNSYIPTLKGGEYPEIFAAFENAELLMGTPSDEAFTKINEESGLKLEADPAHVIEIVDAAKAGKPLTDVVKEWNKKWSEAVNANTTDTTK